MGQLGYIEPFPNLNSMNLKGKVKSISDEYYNGKSEEGTYFIVGPKLNSTLKTDTKFIFDSTGNLIQKNILSINGESIIQDYFIYNDSKPTEVKTKYFHRFYTYDSIGRIEKETIYTQRVGHIKLNGIELKNDSIRQSVINYIYNSKNQLYQKIENGKESVPAYLAQFIYDNSGNLIEERVKQAGFPTEFFKYIHDSNNNLIRSVWSTKEEGIFEQISYVYQKDKLVLQTWENFEEGHLEGKITYEYENSLETEVIEYDSDGSIREKEILIYEFDQKDNWIKKISVTNGDKIIIVSRTIEYY